MENGVPAPVVPGFLKEKDIVKADLDSEEEEAL